MERKRLTEFARNHSRELVVGSTLLILAVACSRGDAERESVKNTFSPTESPVATSSFSPTPTEKLETATPTPMETPKISDIRKSVAEVYNSIDQEVPTDISNQLSICAEQLHPGDDIKGDLVYINMCGRVGAAIRDIYRINGDEFAKKTLEDIEQFTYSQLDEFASQGRLPEDFAENQKIIFKEGYFTP